MSAASSSIGRLLGAVSSRIDSLGYLSGSKGTRQMRFAFSDLEEILPRGAGKCLDVGCGTGRLRPKVERAGYTWVGMNVDIRGNPQDSFVLGDAHSIPFKDESFSVVLLNCVLEHLQDPHLAVKGVQRVLQKGGHICGASSFVEPFHDVASYCHFSHLGIQRLLEKSGFTVIEIEPGVSGLYLLIRAFCGQTVANAFRPILKLMAWSRQYLLLWYRHCRYGRRRGKQLMSDYRRKTALEFAGHILWVGRKG